MGGLLTSFPSYRLALKTDPCSYCSRLKSYARSTLDHIYPRLNGGGRAKPGSKAKSSSGWENLTAACADCNTAKGTDSLLQFMLGRFKRHLKREQAKRRKWIYYDPTKAPAKALTPLQPQQKFASIGSLRELARLVIK